MASTYDELLPTAKDRARALLGDTAVTPGTTVIPTAKALVSDEHIGAVITLTGSFESGVAWLADELVTRFAQQPDSLSDAGSSLRWSERVAAWQALATRMRVSAATSAAASANAPRPRATLNSGPAFTREMP